MKITAETTDAQILSPVESAKAALLGFVTGEIDSGVQNGERMVALAQNVRSAEAVASAAWGYRNLLAAEADLTKRMDYLFRLVSQSDDSWSGRGNDSRRSARDAVVAFANRQMDEIRYGQN